MRQSGCQIGTPQAFFAYVVDLASAETHVYLHKSAAFTVHITDKMTDDNPPLSLPPGPSGSKELGR